MSEESQGKRAIYKPQVEEIQRELSRAESIDDFFGKAGIFARLFARPLEGMLEAALSEQLGYEKYEAKGRNSGNSRNGKRSKQVQTSAGEQTVAVPRDRNGEFASPLLAGRRSNELEEKVISLYAKGTSTRDLQRTLAELYGVEVTAATISAITDKIWPLVEEWQNRPLDAIYAIVYLDALYVKLRREGKVENVAVYDVLGVNLEGQKEGLGHWVGTGAEGANFWLSVLTDLQQRGVTDIFITCVDGLKGFSEAIEAVFPAAQSELVFLNACRSAALAQYLACQGVPCVIAYTVPVLDRNALRTASYYYEELVAHGMDYRRAFEKVTPCDGSLAWFAGAGYIDKASEPLIATIGGLQQEMVTLRRTTTRSLAAMGVVNLLAVGTLLSVALPAAYAGGGTLAGQPGYSRTADPARRPRCGTAHPPWPLPHQRSVLGGLCQAAEAHACASSTCPGSKIASPSRQEVSRLFLSTLTTEWLPK
jgi:hypothetical protein